MTAEVRSGGGGKISSPIDPMLYPLLLLLLQAVSKTLHFDAAAACYQPAAAAAAACHQPAAAAAAGSYP